MRRDPRFFRDADGAAVDDARRPRGRRRQLSAARRPRRRHRLHDRRPAAAAAGPGARHRRAACATTAIFRALNVPLLRGRLFTEREMREQSNVVVINEALAQRYFPHEDPIGKRLTIAMTDAERADRDHRRRRRHQDRRSRPATRAPMTFWPHPQLAYSAMTLTLAPRPIRWRSAPSVEREVRAIDKDQPVSDVRTMDQWVSRVAGAGALQLAAADGVRRRSRCCWRRSAFTASCRTPSASARRRSASASRSAPSARDILGMIVGNGVRLARDRPRDRRRPRRWR